MAVPESSVESSRPAENMNNKKQDAKIKDKKVIVAAQEIKYAKYLAGNEKKTRDKALKSLMKWLQQRCVALPFSEADFMLLWKGLFYSMWMSDKPLIQEECADNIARLIHSLTPDRCMMFFKCGLKTLGNEWFGIDQLRLDKFLMLVRRMLRQGFIALKQQNWSMKMVKEFQQALDDTVLNTEKKPPLGLCLHFTEIYLEELAKVSEGKIHPMLMIEFLVPFTKQLSLTNEERQMMCITKHIFKELMRQSDAGLEFNEKFHAWKRMGFPGGNIDALEKGDVSSDDEKMSDEEEHSGDQTVLDPRAGRVNVDLPQLKINPKHMVNLLTQFRFAPGSSRRSRKAINRLIAEFSEMMHGRYPLGIKKVKRFKEKGKSTKLKQSTNRLIKLEKELQKKVKKRKADDEDPVEQPQPKKQKGEAKLKKHKHDEDSKLRKSNLKSEKDDTKLINGKKNLKHSFQTDSDVPSFKKSKLVKTKAEADSDDSLSAETVFKNFESAFPRNSGTWYVYNGDASGGDDMSNDESWVMTDEDIPEQNENVEVKKRKMTKPVKWNRNCSIQLVKESLKSPKRIKSPKKLNGSESAKNLIFTSQTIVPPRNDESLKKKQNIIGSPKKTIDNSAIGSPKKVNYDESHPKNNVISILESPQSKNFEISSIKKSHDESVKQIRHSPKLADNILMNKDEGNSPAVNGVKNMIEIKKQSPKRSENAAIADTQVNFEPEEVSTPKKNLFAQTDWDSPLKDGEVEFFVTSNKYKQKMEKLAKQSKQNMSDLINTSLARVKGKNRASLDPNLVRNPFARNGTPRSTGKKVKIDLRLNKSQEIHEHVATIKRSPAIPFDANKKPVKPLLKPNAVTSPINPFYKRRLNL